MLRLLLFLPIGFVLSSCSSQTKDSIQNSEIQNDTSKIRVSLLGDSFKGDFRLSTKGNYVQTKADIGKLRQSYTKHYKSLSKAKQAKYLDTVNEYFVNLLLNDLIPYWYGTDWDFNGISPNPGKGSIACGYFVSTTLRHMGIQVNRYKLAQQGGTNEAKTLALANSSSYWKRIRSKYKKLEDMFTHVKDGLYFVGLDNHVGYFYKRGASMYFINSDYYVDKVVGDTIEESEVFSSQLYVFANISHNRDLMKKWLLQEIVKVVQ